MHNYFMLFVIEKIPITCTFRFLLSIIAQLFPASRGIETFNHLDVSVFLNFHNVSVDLYANIYLHLIYWKKPFLYVLSF
jgi:hypothetical protein